MRAMILAAGLGTRMQPLTHYRAKPALPVHGVPVIAYLLALLARHCVKQVTVNLHHQSDSILDAIEKFRPDGMEITVIHESAPRGTGGGIRGAAGFLAESDPCLVLAGDMILDLDLTEVVARHRARGDLATLVLREDPRAAQFGTIGLDAESTVCRIGERRVTSGEVTAGVFSSVRVFSPRIFESLPEREHFEDLRDWLVPAIEAGARDIRGEIYAPQDCSWEPVGTPAEYLAANLRPRPPAFTTPDLQEKSSDTRLMGDVVLGAGCEVAAGARLSRCVVWDGESVPGDAEASDAVFAGGSFHTCVTDSEGNGA
jgi:mannose-1-phosphate guanylyltransferase